VIILSLKIQCYEETAPVEYQLNAVPDNYKIARRLFSSDAFLRMTAELLVSRCAFAVDIHLCMNATLSELDVRCAMLGRGTWSQEDS